MDPLVHSDGHRGGLRGDARVLDTGTAGTVISRNIAVGNGDDGIDLDSAGARLVRNLANDNADLGIVAPPGTQAPGNLASGNGKPGAVRGSHLRVGPPGASG